MKTDQRQRFNRGVDGFWIRFSRLYEWAERGTERTASSKFKFRQPRVSYALLTPTSLSCWSRHLTHLGGNRAIYCANRRLKWELRQRVNATATLPLNFKLANLCFQSAVLQLSICCLRRHSLTCWTDVGVHVCELKCNVENQYRAHEVHRPRNYYSLCCRRWRKSLLLLCLS